MAGATLAPSLFSDLHGQGHMYGLLMSAGRLSSSSVPDPSSGPYLSVSERDEFWSDCAR